MYTYRDLVTGKTKATRGEFAGWTKKTGLLKTAYAIFKNPKGVVLVPEYLLTKETRERVGGSDQFQTEAELPY